MWQKRKCSVKNGYLTISHGTVREEFGPTTGRFPLREKETVFHNGVEFIHVTISDQKETCLCGMWNFKASADSESNRKIKRTELLYRPN